jgi:hypothetical protein
MLAMLENSSISDAQPVAIKLRKLFTQRPASANKDIDCGRSPGREKIRIFGPAGPADRCDERSGNGKKDRTVARPEALRLLGSPS